MRAKPALETYNSPVVSAAIVSALHVLALAIGLPAIFLRGRALKSPLDAAGLGRLFAADTVWGLAALLWIVTGLLRAFGGLEKGAPFYLHSRLFWLKLALFALVVVLELWPMITFIRWRGEQRRGRLPDTTNARRLYAISHAEMALVLVIVFVAAFMARGF
jgi:putative membrane protein